MIRLGIENLAIEPPASLSGKRLGLLCNQSSTDSKFKHSRDIVQHVFPGQLTCLFTPQHGFFSEKQDNMIESTDMVDLETGLPVFSLYGEVRKPTRKMFDHIDVLLVDLLDVGTRVYTFLYTLGYCIEAAAEFGKKIVVLDRPNPIGGEHVEGNVLQEDCRSFVGLYPIPMRHGMTLGELALFINNEFNIHAELEIIKTSGWQRSKLLNETNIPFVYPSPNMPSLDTALVYPGQVIFEGTNISEGRGTALPFELCGAPFLSHKNIVDKLHAIDLPGCVLRPVMFEPTSNKWKGETCKGFQIHVTNPDTFRPYRMSLALLQALIISHNEFRYKEPPYEYEYERMPIDLILGNIKVREMLEKGINIMEIEKSWQNELKEFDDLRRKYYLYN